MAKVLENFKEILPQEKLKENEQLRAPAGKSSKPVAKVDFGQRKEALQDAAEEKATNERDEFLKSKSFPELHSLVLEGSLSFNEIINLDHLDNPLKSVLLAAEQLRKELETTKNELAVTRRERSLIQDENKELKKEIRRLKKSAS